MKRTQINRGYHRAVSFFSQQGWALLPHFRWDITDFGLADFEHYGLVLINLAEEPEYCEKLMYAEQNQQTPAHYHLQKKEDIICRSGKLSIQLWPAGNTMVAEGVVLAKLNGSLVEITGGDILLLQAGERITLLPGVWHAFWPNSPQCIIGEVSTANNDAQDNFFDNPDIGRFPHIEEDEPAAITLLSEKV
jgi:hypothetical protein